MTESRRDEVKKAIEDIRHLYATGQASLEARPGAGYGKGAIDKEAKRRGMNSDTLRKARYFAHPGKGYSEEDLEELCRLVEGQVNAPEGHAIFGKTHVIRLLAAPKDQRDALQRRAIAEGWSSNRLKTETNKLTGRQRQGGRPPEIPSDRQGVYTQLEQMCEQWRRWLEELEQRTSSRKKKRVRLKDLPDELRERLVRAGKVVRRLQDLVAEELQGLRSSQKESASSAEEEAPPTKKRRKSGKGK